MTRRLTLTVVVLAAAGVLTPRPARAAIEYGRAGIVSVNWDQLTMELKDPKNRIFTAKFSRNATVKFSDGARFFPNPSTKDLRAPMYVHFTAEDGVIQSFDVRGLGFTPGNEESASGKKELGVARTVTGKLTAYDTNVKQIEMEINGVRETFQLTSAVGMTGLAAGQRVQVKTDWAGDQELVHELKILGQ